MTERRDNRIRSTWDGVLYAEPADALQVAVREFIDAHGGPQYLRDHSVAQVDRAMAQADAPLPVGTRQADLEAMLDRLKAEAHDNCYEGI